MIYIRFVEEPGLARRFGEDYEEYRRNVPRWAPRAHGRRPWSVRNADFAPASEVLQSTMQMRGRKWLLISLLAVPKVKQKREAMFDRITFDSQIVGGRACIRGMRIPVSVIVGQIAHGASWDEVLQGYPDLEPEDIQQSLEYAAWLTHEEVRTA
jgi:uncharacterized protein (DUF433 family)